VTPRKRLAIALDVATPDAARALVDALAGKVGMFKVGSQLFTAAGPAFVRELVARGERVFLDLKYHDIPNTVRAAVAEAAGLGVSLVDVHALGGPAMIREAARALAGSPTRLLGITVLTSHDEAWLEAVELRGSLPDAVVRLALLARDAGAHGVVASPHEVGLVRQACGRDFVVVTPGIRPAGARAADQARAATPAAAIAAGADYLVLGRPVTEAPDPAAAVEAVVEEMAAAAQGT
jgi:orotidine-5'-phosphate decarboxylase